MQARPAISPGAKTTVDRPRGGAAGAWRFDPFQRLALLTTLLTYLLIGVGGLVRATGSGLGCPDWPRCFERWIPPLDASQVPAHIDPLLFNFAKAWTEYLNRLLGVLVGVFIFSTLILAIRRHRRTPRVLAPTGLAFVFVGVEGWLGGQVVRSELAPAVLTAHLVLALLVVSLLLYATVSAFFPGGRPLAVLPPDRRTLGRMALGAGILCLAQTGIGAAVRGEIQLVAESLPRAEWLASTGALGAVHRAVAALLALVVLGLCRRALADEPRGPQGRRPRSEPQASEGPAGEFTSPLTGQGVRTAALASIALVIAQAAAGLGLAHLDFPRALQVLHLWLGALLLGALSVLWLLVHRLDPRVASC